MSESAGRPTPDDEVDSILRNAALRDELEPYFDESIMRISTERMPTEVENEFLASMLAWERAPALPICQWFNPPLEVPAPDRLSEKQLQSELYQAVKKLYGQRIVLEFTDHLSDRELYTLIYRDILPSHEKKIDNSDSYLHWDCSSEDPEVWLRYYASEEEREGWAEHSLEPLPPQEEPPHRRDLPKQPM